MYFDSSAANDPDQPEKMRKMQACFGPQQVDTQIRQAIQFCWMMLPADRQNTEGVAAAAAGEIVIGPDGGHNRD